VSRTYRVARLPMRCKHLRGAAHLGPNSKAVILRKVSCTFNLQIERPAFFSVLIYFILSVILPSPKKTFAPLPPGVLAF